MAQENKSSDDAAGPAPFAQLPWISGLVAGLRQLSFPSAFRIGAPSLSPEAICEPEGQSAEEGTAHPAATVREPPAAETKELLRLLTDLATGLWRIKRKLEMLPENVPPEEMRRLRRHVQSAWDVLSSGKVEVQDLTGEKYVDGMALKVIAFQPTEGVGARVIGETIRPSIRYRDCLIQRGEIIVAIPPESGAQLRQQEEH